MDLQEETHPTGMMIGYIVMVYQVESSGMAKMLEEVQNRKLVFTFPIKVLLIKRREKLLTVESGAAKKTREGQN